MVVPALCMANTIKIHHWTFDTALIYLFEYLHLCTHPSRRERSLAAAEVYESWTDPSSLSCADLREGNENNERKGLKQFGSCPTGPHCTMGLTQDRREGHKGRSLSGLFGQHEEREWDVRGGSSDDGWGSSGCLWWTGLRGRTEVYGQDCSEVQGVGTMIHFLKRIRTDLCR